MKFDEIMQQFEALSEEANMINERKLSLERQFYSAGILQTPQQAVDLAPDDFTEENLDIFRRWVNSCRDKVMSEMGFIIEDRSSENWIETDLQQHARISAGGNWFYDFIKVYGKYVSGFIDDLSSQKRVPAFIYLDQLPDCCKNANILTLD